MKILHIIIQDRVFNMQLKLWRNFVGVVQREGLKEKDFQITWGWELFTIYVNDAWMERALRNGFHSSFHNKKLNDEWEHSLGKYWGLQK